MEAGFVNDEGARWGPFALMATPRPIAGLSARSCPG